MEEVRKDVEADGYTVDRFEPPYLYVNTGGVIEKWIEREPGVGSGNTHWGNREFEFCSSIPVWGAFRVELIADGSWYMDAPLSVVGNVFRLRKEAIDRIIAAGSEPVCLYGTSREPHKPIRVTLITENMK